MTTLSATPDRLRPEARSRPAATPIPEPVLLIIADISGYTRYMTANAKTLSHSQVVITELVEAIIREIELPLEVAKLEGDAVFLFCRKSGQDRPWSGMRRTVSEKLLSFFRKFSAKVAELSQSTTCTCDACTHIEHLRLKVIVHSGEALFHRVHNFLELAGVDVIIVHRLLKNSVAADQYLLLSESAARELEFDESLRFDPAAERYDEIGRINTLVYHPETPPPPVASPPLPDELATRAEGSPVPAMGGSRFSAVWNLYWNLWFAPLKSFAGSPPGKSNGDQRRPSRGSQFGWAALTLALTPGMLLVGWIFVWLHVRQARSTNSAAARHPAGCKCGLHH